MATESVLTGDTEEVKAIFTDLTGLVVDPDGLSCTFTCYNDSEKVVSTGAAIRQGPGIYVFEWVVPLIENTVYILEMKGIFNSHPQVQRTKVKAKFRI